MRPLLAVYSIALLCSSALHGQAADLAARAIRFPDVPGYLTLKCDLHMHTVFSDGNVWPNIRVQEALRDGLDAIAVTEHIEYQPYRDDIPHPDRNRAHSIAVDAAKDRDLIVLLGSEITRDMPPGHANAVFLQDANGLLVNDSIEVFREARRQGAFIFWNHPNWTSQRSDGIASLSPMHVDLIGDDLLQGIEVVNDLTYSDEAIQIAIDHDLTMIGTSDIHGLVDWQYRVPQGGHRPVTLVFATERSAAGIQEGLEARRTAVWFDNVLIGREQHLVPLVMASLGITQASYQGDTSVLSVMIENESDAEYVLMNRSDLTFHANSDVVTLAPNQTTRLQVKTRERLPSVTLVFEVLNAVTAPKTHPIIELEIVLSGN